MSHVVYPGAPGHPWIVPQDLIMLCSGSPSWGSLGIPRTHHCKASLAARSTPLLLTSAASPLLKTQRAFYDLMLAEYHDGYLSVYYNSGNFHEISKQLTPIQEEAIWYAACTERSQNGQLVWHACTYHRCQHHLMMHWWAKRNRHRSQWQLSFQVLCMLCASISALSVCLYLLPSCTQHGSNVSIAAYVLLAVLLKVA